MSYKDLLAAKKAAEEALVKAEAELLAELLAAKDAHRKDASEAKVARKAAAAAALREFRAEVRKHRTGTAVGGDAFLSPAQNGG